MRIATLAVATAGSIMDKELPAAALCRVASSYYYYKKHLTQDLLPMLTSTKQVFLAVQGKDAIAYSWLF